MKRKDLRLAIITGLVRKKCKETEHIGTQIRRLKIQVHKEIRSDHQKYMPEEHMILTIHRHLLVDITKRTKKIDQERTKL